MPFILANQPFKEENLLALYKEFLSIRKEIPAHSTKMPLVDNAHAVVADTPVPTGPNVKLKDDNQINETVEAIRSTTEKVIAGGPEACRKYLWDAGIETEPSTGMREDKELMKKAIAMRDAYNSYISELALELFVFRGGRSITTKEEREKSQHAARYALSVALKPFIGSDLLEPTIKDNNLSPFDYAGREGYCDLHKRSYIGSCPVCSDESPELPTGVQDWKPLFPDHVPDEIFKEASSAAYLSPEAVHDDLTTAAYIQGFCVAHARYSPPVLPEVKEIEQLRTENEDLKQELAEVYKKIDDLHQWHLSHI
jgi:hypothetical protein